MAPENETNHRLRTRLLRFVTYVLTIFITLAVTYLWEWVTAPSTDLSARITHANFRLPEAIRKELPNSLDSNGEASLLWSPYYNENMTFWYATVKNGKSGKVDSVNLFLPDVNCVEITKNGSTTDFAKLNGKIPLGTLYPTDEVVILAWGRTPYSSDRAGIKLTHLNGVGEVSTDLPESSIWSFQKAWILYLFWLIVLLAALGFFGWTRLQRWKGRVIALATKERGKERTIEYDENK